MFRFATSVALIWSTTSTMAFSAELDGLAENNQGVRKINSGNFEGAISDFSEALRKRPHYVLALVNRALAKTKLKDFEGALTDYNEALKISPGDFSAVDGRAHAYFSLGNYSKALDDYTDLIRRDQKSRPFYLHARAQVKKKMGDPKGANADLAEAKKLRRGGDD